MSNLSKAITVLRYCRQSYANSVYVKQKTHQNRIHITLDLIYCFLRYGHDFNDYCTFELWNKTSEERDSYISFRRNDVLSAMMSTPSTHKLFLDKARFNQRFAPYISRRWFIIDKEVASLESFVRQCHKVIVKPLSDYGGHGVFSITADEPSLVDKIRLVQSGMIVEECIQNADNIKRIAPSSLNTIRVVTVIDHDGKLHIVAALLRMGNGTALTDNYHNGGMACPIDLERRCLTRYAYGMDNKRWEVHPFSGITFDGYALPEIDECLQMVRSLAQEEPSARYVGWDFAVISHNGKDKVELLEANIPPGEDITQIATGRGMWYEMLRWK